MRARLRRLLRGAMAARFRLCRRGVVAVRPAPAGSWWVCAGELLYLVHGRPDEIADLLTRDPYFYPERQA